MAVRTTKGRRTGRARARAGVVVATCALLVLTACTGDAEPEPDPTPAPPSPTAPVEPTALSYGVWGPPEELAAHQRVVDTYNAENDGVEVSLITYPDRDAAMAALLAGARVPDLFLVTRRDFPAVREAELNQPVSALLGERGIDFGDGYQRNGLLAFSGDDALQCMPFGNSPMVMFLNTDLVDFERMADRELPVPRPGGRWSFAQFTAAAEFATRPRRNTRGVYIEPTLEALSPFVRAAGGTVFDSEDEPTSLAFGDEDTREALETPLEVLRLPTLTPSEEQLDRRTPVELFERGRLAMIAGFRDLVPQLREVDGLSFDVISLPSIAGRSTVGQLSGLCMSRETPDPEIAADFLAYAVSTPAMSEVVEAGYLVPANLEVAESDAFLQPGQDPPSAGVFNTAVRDIALGPLLLTWEELAAAVDPLLVRLLHDPILVLEEIGEEIDEASRTVLSPEDEADDESGDEDPENAESGDE